MFGKKKCDEFLKFNIKDYLDIKELEFSISMNTSWLFLVGENGSGKTTILQAIARSLSDEHSVNKYDVVLRIGVNESKKSQTLVVSDSHVLPNVIGYGSQRSDMHSPSSTIKKHSAINLYDSNEYLKNVEEIVLSRWYLVGKWKKKHKECVKVFKALIPELHAISVDERYQVFYEFKDESNKINKKSYCQLSTSYQSLIARIGDMYIELNNIQEESSNGKTIVIFDNFESFFSNKMQRELPEKLTKLFPDVVFVCSTQSSSLIKGVNGMSKSLKIENSDKNGITLKNITNEESINFLESL
jgi:predicted ATP-binding protein involved in virulence